jgi:hypothetical protein
VFVVSSYPAEGERPADLPADTEHKTLEEAREEVCRRLKISREALDDPDRRWRGCNDDIEAYNADSIYDGGCAISVPDDGQLDEWGYQPDHDPGRERFGSD